MRQAAHRFIATAIALFVAAMLLAPATAAQLSQPDLRVLHQQAVFATVRIESAAGLGTGWLLRQNVPRPIVITNRHVVGRVGAPIRVVHYLGSDGRSQETAAAVQWLSDSIDLAIVRLEADPPATARSLDLESGDIVRGERIVLGGQPNGLPFQTTEGVVTGHLPESPFSATCGQGRNCVVVDAAAFAGSSGGPAINAQGHVVGMLWGTDVATARTSRGTEIPIWVRNPSFAFLIHVRTIEQELRAYGEQLRDQRARAAPAGR